MTCLLFLNLLAIISIQFITIVVPVYGQESITEEYVVSILSGEKKNLNYAGQKEIKKTPVSSKISFKINFDYDSAEIRESSYDIIVALGKTLESDLFSGDRFKIIGHTDSKGTEQYNKALSMRRAESVKQILTEFFSVEPRVLKVTGMGETNPIATNDSESGRAKNRRVEIIKMEK